MGGLIETSPRHRTTYGSVSWQSGLGHEEDYAGIGFILDRTFLSLGAARPISAPPAAISKELVKLREARPRDPFKSIFNGFLLRSDPSNCRPYHAVPRLWLACFLAA